jgi:hypothetical protein
MNPTPLFCQKNAGPVRLFDQRESGAVLRENGKRLDKFVNFHFQELRHHVRFRRSEPDISRLPAADMALDAFKRTQVHMFFFFSYLHQCLQGTVEAG